MKQKDIALVAVVVFVSAVLSIILSSKLITPPTNRQTKVEVVQPISSEFNAPNTKYFNAQSNDPTQLIHIGDTSNPDPFKNN